MRSRAAPARLQVRRVTALVAGSLCAALLAACGADDFDNEPRPPAPVALTAAIDDRSVSISPSQLGAGLVTVTISNQSRETLRLTIDGPTSASSSDIVPGGTGNIKTALEEGDYEVSADSQVDIESAELEVGPTRPSSQNDLLLP